LLESQQTLTSFCDKVKVHFSFSANILFVTCPVEAFLVMASWLNAFLRVDLNFNLVHHTLGRRSGAKIVRFLAYCSSGGKGEASFSQNLGFERGDKAVTTQYTAQHNITKLTFQTEQQKNKKRK